MKRIIYLSFYFKPDICAGSFRNSTLVIELAKQTLDKNIVLDVFTTLPNRYSTFYVGAQEYEEIDNLRIHRIAVPSHRSGMLDQVFAFWHFYNAVWKFNQSKNADLVFASSSRLFTAYLGYKLAKKCKAPLYLDIRDLFVDTINDIFKLKLVKIIIIPILKIIEAKTFNYAKHINLISSGFKDYFLSFKSPNYSYFPNGIDEEFISGNKSNHSDEVSNLHKLIVYAGNIGEGQGLHRIIPRAAQILGNSFKFLIIGDGGAKKLLEEEIKNLGLTNVILNNPVSRDELQSFYLKSDFLFLHLNDYPAFRKVLPSKIFELATFNKPIIAGVAGFSAHFIKNEVSHSFVFNPCDAIQLVEYLKNSKSNSIINRSEFVERFRRSKINNAMAESILSYI
ncbi:glycosyltransferase family 4 protein [Aquirufa rosea]|uniref:Glycosyltransferase WbuB n=1 Tax=Aquirufa rosea TaxID=2509241 RepID=A0A4Q1BYU5_9BACT|nr:glycosyltransferase family 4 protein [Aquirufa rosea]RXK48263.1 glycosyltransferase WbuB [Aquirufa rosea]